MRFINYQEVEKHLKDNGRKWTLQNFGRHRVAPGFTVADYVKIGEFYRTASKHCRIISSGFAHSV